MLLLRGYYLAITLFVLALFLIHGANYLAALFVFAAGICLILTGFLNVGFNVGMFH